MPRLWLCDREVGSESEEPAEYRRRTHVRRVGPQRSRSRGRSGVQRYPVGDVKGRLAAAYRAQSRSTTRLKNKPVTR